ncbi:hypothetical protein CI109_102838 [Kwoniella shandongensis]|uniref:Uncharacterized protein n=1 Tax=Kwoniella shandongensis TaxID=1734106 RepID=A0AAJ8LFS2_9TREE
MSMPSPPPPPRRKSASTAASSRNSNTPTMSNMNGQPRGVSYSGANGTPPMANGRRMTSNPTAPGPPMNGHPIDPAANVNQQGPMTAYNPIQRPPPVNNSSPVVGGGSPNPNPNAYPSALVNNTSYPWMIRPLRLYHPQTSPPSAPQSPFPRYGLSVPAFPSHSGHMLIFGGLVHERVRNDLWSMDIRDCVTMPVKTKGETPIPRVGHASAMADRIMIVWGGDTKVNVDDAQDEGLYILDLRSQEWTSVPVSSGPQGRYGHAVTLLEGKFYVFGGQADGAFMNDLWMYDLKQLSGTTHHWEEIHYTTPAPPKRTGHILVGGNNGKLYLFGGTDGNYHYNDTWSFDLATGAWTELSCIGYIPLPREGHAAAIVDETIYVFGGRDVKGKDLGDLAAFKLSNQRWYMFQNMGPAPSARSGHAMVAASGKIFIVGGEANQALTEARDDPSMIHILDTSKIKYPPDNVPPRPVNRNPQSIGAPPREESPSKNVVPSDTPPQSVKRVLAPSASMDSLNRAASPPAGPDRSLPTTQPLGSTLPRSESGDLAIAQSEQATPRAVPTGNGVGPPQRPRREGDDEFRRALSPTNGPASPQQGNFHNRVTSPTNAGPASPPQNPKIPFNASILGTRSPSPRLRMADGGDRPAPPPDAFYYGKSPTANGFSGRPGSLSGSHDLLKELKHKDSEVEAGKKRETALKVILSRAIQQGFVGGGEAEDLNFSDGDDEGGEGKVDEKLLHQLTDALVRLKQDKASIQNELVAQTRVASDRAMEAERLRRGALQEAAFYRAKIATLESNSHIDLARLEKERINELERQLGMLAADHAATQKELDAAHDAASNAKSLHSAASERETETLKRAEEAEDAHKELLMEMEQLQDRASTAEQSLREHTERLITLSSTVQQREAERDHLQSQLDEAIAARDENIGLIEQAQAAITSAGLRTSEMEAMYGKANARVAQLEEELAETKADLDARSRDANLAGERMREVENAYSKSREEADSLRAVTTSRLGELLDSHKEMRADESRTTRGHQEQLRALEEEAQSLRKMLKEAGQRVDAAESGVSNHRQKSRDLEGKVQTLRGELRASRTKLVNAQTELSRYKDISNSRDGELREKEMLVTEVETRCTMLRNLLADHGIAVNDSDLDNASNLNGGGDGSGGGGEGSTTHTRELESQLRERTRAYETSQRELEDLRMRCEEAEDKVESLGRLVERIKDARSPTSQSMRSPTPTGESDRRVGELEKRLNDMEREHKEKVKGIEADYQTAVRYVKGTEKMLKRMKDELNKQKTANASLQSEIDSLRGRSSEPGARTRDASGRSTPSGIFSAGETAELQRKLQTLEKQHTKLQEDFAASQDVLNARNREVDLLRMRLEEAEREMEGLREDLREARQRIETLLAVGGVSSDDEGEGEGEEGEGSEEASMAFDKFTKELKQWERSRSPGEDSNILHEHEHDSEGEDDDDNTVHLPSDLKGNHDQGGLNFGLGQPLQHHNQQQSGGGHRRNSSEYSGDWVQ